MRKSLAVLSLIAISTALACAPAPNKKGKVAGTYDAALEFQPSSIARLGLNGSLALTVDDGPTTAVTDALLDLLSEEDIKATFFLNGRNVKGREATLRRMKAEGHEIANHAHNHNQLREVADGARGMQGVFDEINDSHKALLPYFQEGGRLYFRAPEGAWRDTFAPYLNQDPVLRNYIGPVFWDIGGAITRDKDTKEIVRDANGAPVTAADWDCWTPVANPKLSVEECAAGYFNETQRRQGGIVLVHDRKMQSVEMLRILIPQWKAAGYKFTTLDELPQLEQYQ